MYLGSNLSKKRETGEDIQARIGKARGTRCRGDR